MRLKASERETDLQEWNTSKALTSVTGKILEKIVRNQLVKFLENN